MGRKDKLNRIIYLINLLFEGKRFTTKEIEEELSISRRTVQRDIKELSKYLNILSDEEERYYIDIYKDKKLLPMYLNKDHLNFLYLSILSLNQFHSDNNIKKILLNQVERLVSPVDRKRFSILKKSLFIKKQYYINNEEVLSNFNKLLDALMERRIIKVKYGKKIGEVDICVYGFSMVKENVYVLIKYLNSDKIYQFRVDKIKKIVFTNNTYQIDGSFNVEEYYKYAFGAENSKEEKMKVKIKMNRKAYKSVENKVFNHTQKLTTIDQEYKMFEIEVVSWEEIIKWILSFGKNVEVIEPIELRKHIENEILEIRRIYYGDK